MTRLVPSGAGVHGFAWASSGFTKGVSGHVNSASGWSAYFTGAPGSRNYFERSVGIATLNPGGFWLAVNGDAAKPGGGSWAEFSQCIQAVLLDFILPIVSNK